MLFAISLTNLLATILELTIQVYKVHRSIGVQHLEYFEMLMIFCETLVQPHVKWYNRL